MSLIAALLLAGVQPQLATVGKCGWVHGRYRLANGSGVHRIWVIGTDHVINLDVSDESTPPPLKHIFARRGYDPFLDRIYGEFYVCARQRRIPGHMQVVHLKRTRNLQIVTSRPS